MGEEQLASEPIMLPFYIADAWLERIARAISSAGTRASTRRRQLSTGSTQVDILIAQKRIGHVDLIAFRPEITILATVAHTDNAPARRRLLTLDQIIRTALNHVVGQGLSFDAEAEPLRTDLRAWAQSLIATQPPEPSMPQPGDSVDMWLDWRERAQRKGQHITLEAIAEQSGLSLSTIKKHSAERKVRKEPKE